jgi:hypothetical protein
MFSLAPGPHQTIYSSFGRGMAEFQLTLKGRNMSFIKLVKCRYLGVVFDRRVSWRIEAKDLKI